jgi:hypothetical protein
MVNHRTSHWLLASITLLGILHWATLMPQESPIEGMSPKSASNALPATSVGEGDRGSMAIAESLPAGSLPVVPDFGLPQGRLRGGGSR